jgi:cytoplasmic iron level regulating protein YaaA (DUF328/UPF0246 family)
MEILNGRIDIRILNETFTLDFEQKALFDKNNNKVKGALDLYRMFVKQENIEEPNNFNNHSYIGAIKKHLKKKLKFSISVENHNLININNTPKNNSERKLNRINTVNNIQRSKNDKDLPKDEWIEQKIKDVMKSLPLEKIKDKNRKKLLIIGCSDSKDISNPINAKNLFKDCFGHDLKEARDRRMDQYIKLLKDEKNEKYFRKKRNGKEVDSTHFFDALKGDLYYAIDLYGSNHSQFFNKSMKECYKNLMEVHNFQILIISGLYGVLEPYDTIRDYHLQINKKPFWTKNTDIKDAISNFIDKNKIQKDMVFYSLSKEYLSVLHANPEWKDFWISHDRGSASTRLLREYFLPNL